VQTLKRKNMEKAMNVFRPLEAEALAEHRGGSFAYDVGRFLRFLYISGGASSAAGIAAGMADWVANDAANNL
jgi:hypothetical protein